MDALFLHILIEQKEMSAKKVKKGSLRSSFSGLVPVLSHPSSLSLFIAQYTSSIPWRFDAFQQQVNIGDEEIGQKQVKPEDRQEHR